MPYLHKFICISAQNTFPVADLTVIRESENNLLHVIEPDYPGIPNGLRRRMGKHVRMAVGAALPLLQHAKPDGIVIATANGGMEDCIKFLNQIIEYKEGLLTPGNFVQSTSNAAAAQIALITKNHNYNITHVHRGLAFENALLDVVMLLNENPSETILLGCTDEISTYNYNIEKLDGWYRSDPVSNHDLFLRPAKGTIAGEGSFMVLMNNNPDGATAELKALKTIHTKDQEQIIATLTRFLEEHAPEGFRPDVLITGENGDERMNPYYYAVEQCFGPHITVARFKHLSGEFCTASSFACWLAVDILQTGIVAENIIKKKGTTKNCKNILIYNNYRGEQHSFILMLANDQ